MKVVVIIPAAGRGTRMAAAEARPGASSRAPATPKQFAELNGVPILVHTLRAFAASPQVEEIYVALRGPDAPDFRSRLDQEKLGKKVHIVEGGDNRQQSVANALNAVHAAPDDVVLVHDAVRPFVDAEIISSVIAAAAKHGAAIAGLPAVDTVKQVERTADGAIITATVPRERVVLAQTPQGFRFALLKSAFDEALSDGFTGTDEASLVERAGAEVAVVMGSPRNIKITTPADLDLAEFYLRQTKKPSAADERG
ncbi:MAG TPA: 2-C-methyl-D-erythritol 4-phosphate cytidylyltransferase [Terriglobales bacterium]|nr:2-C-methyl-D-erythritol 4-phosphate cytidylyltransferase [Terriglobales bacterium]